MRGDGWAGGWVNDLPALSRRELPTAGLSRPGRTRFLFLKPRSHLKGPSAAAPFPPTGPCTPLHQFQKAVRGGKTIQKAVGEGARKKGEKKRVPAEK